MREGSNLAPTAELSLAGRVTSADGDAFRGEILVADERIVAVVPGEPPDRPGVKRIDLGQALLLPGAIDCHAHSGSYGGEGMLAMTRSAAAGGVTTVIDMPYDADGPLDNTDAFAAKAARVEREAVIDVALLATVRPGTGANEVQPLVESGAVGFKLSMFCTDPVRFPRIPDVQFIEILAAIAEANSLACVHAENEEIIKPLIDRARQTGQSRPIDHCRSRPPVSETQAVLTALEYARDAQARLHLCHLSLPRSVDLAAAYAAEGLPVSTETCPHYLCFSEDDMERLGGRLKINPPVRSAGDVAGLWQRLLGGGIDVVASDHAPWPLGHKTAEVIFDNHSGAPGVETLFPIVAGELLSNRGGTVADVVRLTASTPARLFGLDHCKGALRPGMDADVVAFDPSGTAIVDETALHSNAGWSPYHGRPVHGTVLLTMSRGEVVWDGSQIPVAPGRGRLVCSTRTGLEGG
jgi:allantoinase